MRALSITLVCLSLAFAGCFGGDDEGGDPPATTTPAGTTPATTTPATTTPTNETPDNGTGDGGGQTAPPPQDVFTDSFDFVRAPPEEPTTDTFTVPAGYEMLTLNVTFSPSPAGTPVGVNNGISVGIGNPDPAIECAPPASGAQPMETVCTATLENPTEGEWTITFAGEGSWTADIVVTAS